MRSRVSRLLMLAVAPMLAVAVTAALADPPPKPRTTVNAVAPKKQVPKSARAAAGAARTVAAARPAGGNDGQTRPSVRDVPPLRRAIGNLPTLAARPNGPLTKLPTLTRPTPDRPNGGRPTGDRPTGDRPTLSTPDRPGGNPPNRQPPIVVLPLPNNPPATRPDTPRPPIAILPLGPPTTAPPTLPPSAQPPLGTPPQATANAAIFVPDEVLISLPLASPQSLEDDVAQAFNLTILERTAMSLVDQRLVRLRIPDSRAVPAVVAALLADARVPLAQPNFYYRYQQATTLQAASISAAPNLQYALSKISLADAQLKARGGGTVVAVIDSGIEQSHPDFANRPIQQLDAIDLGGATPLDPHGTGVAGIIAGRGTVRGVAPEARLLSVRAFGNAQNRGSATAITSAILKGLTWSVENGARIVNMSFAGVRDPAMERNIAALPARRVIAIAAAGNGGSKAAPAYPAAYPEVIAVTATDQADRLYERANQGSYIALAAPGVDVLVPSGKAEHELQSGTSFAAPHVAGIVALMLEMNPELSVDHIRQLLLASVDDLGRPGRDEQFGAGRINAAKAVAAAAAFRPALASAP